MTDPTRFEATFAEAEELGKRFALTARHYDETGEFPFANFDYPAQDPAFVETVAQEARDILAEIGPAPSLAVLCGGSEVLQQAAMMGLPAERWPGPLFDDIRMLAIHASEGIEGVITGRALYDGRLDLAAAIQMAGRT